MSIPMPTKARGAKSIANLKRGGSPGRPRVTKKEKSDANEVRLIARKLLNDPAYRKELRKHLRTGRIQPGVEVALWQYGFGKPRDVLEVSTPVAVEIRHYFSGAADQPTKKDTGYSH